VNRVDDGAPRRRSRRTVLLAAAAAAGLIGASGWLRHRAALDDPRLTELDLHPRPRQPGPLRFGDQHGEPRSLAGFGGRTVLLNVWATWCPPCRREMAALDRLQAALGGPAFEVVTVSIDVEGLAVVQTFFRQVGIAHLHPYLDTFHEVAVLGATGIPLSLLVDREGREVARKIGPAAWDDPRMVQTIRRFIAPVPP